VHVGTVGLATTSAALVLLAPLGACRSSDGGGAGSGGDAASTDGPTSEDVGSSGDADSGSTGSDAGDCPDASLAGGGIQIASAGYSITVPWYFGTLSADSASGPGALAAAAVGCPEPPSGARAQVSLGVQSDPGTYDVTFPPAGSNGAGRLLSLRDPALASCGDAGASCTSQWIAGYDDAIILCSTGCGTGTIVVDSFAAMTITGTFDVVAEEVVFLAPTYAKTGRTRELKGSFTFTDP